MKIKEELKRALAQVVDDTDVVVEVDTPQAEHGDYTTNVAMILGKKQGKNPMEIAEAIVANGKWKMENGKSLERVEVVKPGFINFWLTKNVLLDFLKQGGRAMERSTLSMAGKKVMVEFAHPNTHKEMHIGHMRTLITGEALSRIFEAAGAIVFRANYQGDIGPHVARALYGIEKLMHERGLSLAEVERWSKKDKAHFLGEGYVQGSKDYEEAKEEIDNLNTKLYQHGESIWPLYEQTRKWSIEYYEEFYTRFYTTFDRLFFESEMAERGKTIVQDHIGDVFVEENGAVIFPGEKYGLHTRVFITQAGNPTYEGKEMGNAVAEYEAFPFDLKMHIVASEQAGYFQVVFKALGLIDPEKFEGKQHHLSMGMVTLTDPSAGSGQARKMSSRTGDVLTVDWLIDQVKEKVEELAREGKIQADKRDETIEMITIGAIKYSVLKGGTGQNAAFDIQKSVALNGNSGPYLQYTFARTQSVLRKSEIQSTKSETISNFQNTKLEPEETALLRKLYQFPEVVQKASVSYAPNYIATYLFDIAQAFNLFYQKHKIVGSEEEASRLALTSATGNVLKEGLNLLGIKAPEKM